MGGCDASCTETPCQLISASAGLVSPWLERLKKAPAAIGDVSSHMRSSAMSLRKEERPAIRLERATARASEREL